MDRNQNILLGGILGLVLVVGVVATINRTVFVSPDVTDSYLNEAYADADKATLVGLSCASFQPTMRATTIEELIATRPVASAVYAYKYTVVDNDGEHATVRTDRPDGSATTQKFVKENNLWRVCPS